jgi:hypothetical protein
MNISAYNSDTRIKSVDFNNDMIVVYLMDGRIISVPLIYYPRLFNATEEQLKNWKISGGGYGIHWPDIDEDLSSEGLLRGAPATVAEHVYA